MAGDLLPIRTERLVLRRFHARDLDAFQRYRADPDVARHQGWDRFTAADAAAFWEEQRDRRLGDVGDWVQIAVADPMTDQLLGDVATKIAADRSAAEIGVTFARDHQGRGFAREALGALVDVLFARLGVARIVAWTAADNVRVHQLLSGLGFIAGEPDGDDAPYALRRTPGVPRMTR
ncbi:MAG: GNAT family protein [Pseudomonadota bacterium]